MRTTGARLDELTRAVAALRAEASKFARWGELLARRLSVGGRLFAAGNDDTQHVTEELVGRFDPPSAVALSPVEFAEQVETRARVKDVLVLVCVTGRSENLVRAANMGRRCGLTVLAFTGPLPNPLAARAGDVLAVDAGPVTVQKIHLASVRLLCDAFETARAGRERSRSGS